MLVRVFLALEPPAVRRRLGRLIEDPGVHVVALESGHPFLEVLTRENFDLILISRSLLGNSSRELITSIRGLPEDPEVVILIDEENAEERAQFLASGCLAVLNQNLANQSLRDTLASLLNRRREEAMHRLQASRPEEQYSLGDFFSNSPAMRTFLGLARKIAGSDTSILILGETGVGKERLARAIHGDGPRNRGPFMAVNCGALPESLLESELFGHEQGAFTGATRARRGYFELAHRGTLFLDEIGEMPLHLQVKLLRAVQDRAIQRVGGEKPIKVDVRLMAASNRDLELDMRSGRFRPDLFYRLAVVTLRVPALRERRDDIAPLAMSYFDRFRASFSRYLTGVDPEALSALEQHDWPGNVRELINVMEHACLLCPGPRITPADLPPRLVRTPGADSLLAGFGAGSSPAVGMPLREARGLFEQAYLRQLLERNQGRIGEAAREAGINPRSLHGLMKRHGLDKRTFRTR